LEKQAGVKTVHFDASALMFGMEYNPAVFSVSEAAEVIEAIGQGKSMSYKMIISD